MKTFQWLQRLLSIAVLLMARSVLAESEDVSIKVDGEARQVRTPKYEATVASDGALTNLRIDGQEFLRAGAGISRGAYFYQKGVVKLTEIEQPTPDAIVAKSDRADVRYEFAPDAMTWTVHNATDAPMHFYLVFDPAVTAVQGEDGWAKPPVSKPWKKTVWFREKARLEIDGSSRVWGPWTGPHQVWDATLKSDETRKVEFRLGIANAEEAAKAAEVGGGSAP